MIPHSLLGLSVSISLEPNTKSVQTARERNERDLKKNVTEEREERAEAIQDIFETCFGSFKGKSKIEIKAVGQNKCGHITSLLCL